MWKWIKRVLLGAAALLALAVVGVAALIAWDSVFPSQRATDFTNITYPGPDGVTLNAYLVRPPGASGPAPAILLIHEFFGINADIIKKADLLAAQGYTVLAVDAYRGSTSPLIPRAIWLVVTTPREQIAADVDAGLRYLAALDGVDAQRIGAVGFCFGGTQVMYAATRNANLASTVIFYGSGPIIDPALLGEMGKNGPVLGIFGEEDTSIPLEEVRGFKLAMDARGIKNTVSVFPGVGHAFVNTRTIAEPGAAQDAWAQMLLFLSDSLQ